MPCRRPDAIIAVVSAGAATELLDGGPPAAGGGDGSDLVLRDGFDVVLRDGSTVHVRPVRRDDEAAMATFLRGLSERSRVLRFFSAATDLIGQAQRTVAVDGADAFGLVALRGSAGEIVGHAGYVREHG